MHTQIDKTDEMIWGRNVYVVNHLYNPIGTVERVQTMFATYVWVFKPKTEVIFKSTMEDIVVFIETLN